MSNRFNRPHSKGRGRQQSGRFESLEGRQLPTALPLVADTAATNAAYIGAVYQEVLGREPDPVGFTWAAGVVNSGQPHSYFTLPLVYSGEAETQFIRSVYQHYLGRDADSAGINFWLGQMQAGVRNEDVEAAFLSSDEFYARAGGTKSAWIQAAFQTVLGRPAEGAAVRWATSQLNAGRSLYDLATVLTGSQEAEARIVRSELTRFGMPVDAAAVATLSTQLSAGQVTEQQVTADILGSPAYFEIHTGVPDTIVPVPNWLPAAPKVAAAIAAQAANGNANVVFIGDSITQLWQTTGLSAWNQDLAPLDSLNAGVAGDGTEDVLWRLQHGNLDGISPKLAVVMIGVNDVGKGNSASDVAAGITSIIRTVQNEFPDANVLLLGVLPGLDVAANSPVRQVIDQTNQRIASLADHQRIWFLNLSGVFLNADGSLNQSLFLTGNLHPNAQGYGLLTQAVAPWVKALVGA